MSRGRTTEDWRKVVFRASKLAPPAARLYLLYLADHMNQKRVVSRGRHLIAADLGVSERMIDKYTTQAQEAGLLSTIVRGRKGMTAVYQGVFPESQREHSVRPISGSQRVPNVRAENAQKVRAETPLSANTGFAPCTGTTSPDHCGACAGWGCERCAV